MGWRGQEAYEADERERRRALPLRQRYRRTGTLIFVAVLALAALYVWASVAHAQSLTNAQVACKIIVASRNAYYATGHPCACPYDHARNGNVCGGRSAYSRPGGAEPKCYPKDVSSAEIGAFRKAHPGRGT
jgi:hypothetical protein